MLRYSIARSNEYTIPPCDDLHQLQTFSHSCFHTQTHYNVTKQKVTSLISTQSKVQNDYITVKLYLQNVPQCIFFFQFCINASFPFKTLDSNRSLQSDSVHVFRWNCFWYAMLLDDPSFICSCLSNYRYLQGCIVQIDGKVNECLQKKVNKKDNLSDDYL